MDVELDPQQPDEVRAAIAEVLDDPPASPDPWWRAGIDEQLKT
jgi:hypothetical protein